MDTSQLKSYAPKARTGFMEAVKARCAKIGLDPKGNHKPIVVKGEFAFVDGHPFPKSLAAQRESLVNQLRLQPYDAFIERIAYTWFNRFMAIRYMEVNGYLDHPFKVFGHPDPNSPVPEILQHAQSLTKSHLPGIKHDVVSELIARGNQDETLYRELLLLQCRALHKAMPFLFENLDDATEVLLPDGLLHTDSVIRTMVRDIDQDLWKEVEVVGWLYQFYISEKKAKVIGKTVKTEDIPAATQLFTPNWIVQYLVQNSIGAQWLATYPDSPLRAAMPYYIEPAEQDPEVQAKLDEITPKTLNPEQMTLLDPACGSGHILVEAYNVFHAIYTERGYNRRDIPRLILKNNLFGLEIDERAAQLSSFALLMRARRDDRRLLAAGGDERDVRPNVVCIQQSNGMDAKSMTEALNAPFIQGVATPIIQDPLNVTKAGLFEIGRKVPTLWQQPGAALAAPENFAGHGNIDLRSVKALIETFEHAKTFGSLIKVDANTIPGLDGMAQRCNEVIRRGDLVNRPMAVELAPLIEQAMVMRKRFDAVVANPPYMGARFHNEELKSFLRREYPLTHIDLFASFVFRNSQLLSCSGVAGFMSPYVWMFIDTYEPLRAHLLETRSIQSLVQLEYSGFDGATVPICAYMVGPFVSNRFAGTFIRLSQFKGKQLQGPRTLEAIGNRSCTWRHTASANDFNAIPGRPLAYWISRRLREAFVIGNSVGSRWALKNGLQTGDVNAFLRRWWEVPIGRTSIQSGRTEGDLESRWFPCNKAGGFRRWFGETTFVVDWEGDGLRIRQCSGGRPQNTEFYFRAGVTWGMVTSSMSSFRYMPAGQIFDNSAPSAFGSDESLLLGFLNSRVTQYCLGTL